MNVRDNRHHTALSAKLGDDVFQIRRVFDCGSRDANDLAADGDEVKRLADARRSVHRVARQHRLLDDWVIAPQDNGIVAA
jgi:hypothetical protein